MKCIIVKASVPLSAYNMKLFLVTPLAVLLSFVGAEVPTEGFSLTPCKIEDKICMRKLLDEFLEKTCDGIADYDIKTIDPLIIDSLDFVVRNNLEPVLILHYKNLNIIGMKNQEFSDFKMDTQAKSIVLQTSADLTITGEVTMEIVNTQKLFSGSFMLKETVLGTSNYEYSFKTDNRGVEHFEIGPETISCQPLTEPVLTFGADGTWDQDEFVKEGIQLFQSSKLQKLIFCNIAQKVYATFIHNLRATARIVPKTALVEYL